MTNLVPVILGMILLAILLFGIGVWGGPVSDWLLETFSLDEEGDPIDDGSDDIDEARESLGPIVDDFRAIASDRWIDSCFGFVDQVNVGVDNIIQLENTSDGMIVRGGVYREGRADWFGVEDVSNLTPCVIDSVDDTDQIYEDLIQFETSLNPVERVQGDLIELNTSWGRKVDRIDFRTNVMVTSDDGNTKEHPYYSPVDDNPYVSIKLDQKLCFFPIQDNSWTGWDGSCADSVDNPWLEHDCLSDSNLHGALDNEYSDMVCNPG